jgi:hypothetical protein
VRHGNIITKRIALLIATVVEVVCARTSFEAEPNPDTVT